MAHTTQLVFVIGSLRAGSFNRVLARCAAELLSDRAHISYLDYADVPFLNQDDEFPAPAAVARVRAEIAAADGVWIFTPEYNGSFPAALKNLLDWLSRPVEVGDYATPRPLTGKPVAVSGVGGRAATAGVRAQLRDLLTYLQADVSGDAGQGFVVPGPVWGGAPYEPDEADRARFAEQAEALLAACSAAH